MSDAIKKLMQDNPAMYHALMAQIACEKSLYSFTELMWEFVEPANKFIGNWHLQAIAEHLEAVTNGEITRLLINVPPGPGWVENLVATARGRIRLGDVVVGDQVLTHKGKYKNVSAVHSQGELPILKITTWNGRVTWAAPSHPYLTPRGWIDAKDLVIGDVLAVISPQEDAMVSRVRPEEARLIGYLVGDGSLTQATISFTNQDEDTILDFEKCANLLGFKISKRKRKNVTICNVLGGAKVHEWLNGLGLLNKNSYEKFIPDIILASGNDTLRNFLGAYWSCDGMIEVRDTKKRGSTYRSSCCTVSERLAMDIQHALTRLGMNPRIRRKSRKLETKVQPGGMYKYINVEVQNESDVALFADMPITDRKLKLAKRCRRGFSRFITPDEIASIESVGTGECKCLTVDGDHSMTWSDIAVHNTMKSLMTNCFWPAWEWIHAPHMRYISTSYSAGLTERDNIRFRQVITSDLYRAMWGDKFGFSKDSFNITKIGNDKTGWKIATSTEGMGTGERGNRVICISYDGLVLTERGMMLIGEIVENMIDVRVASMNIEDESFSWKKITAWKKNPGSKMVEVGFHGGSVKFTPDHKIWTHNRGWVRADSLLATDVLPCTPALDLVDGILINAKHASKVNLPVSGKNYISDLVFGKGSIRNFSFIAALSDAIRSMSPRSPAAYGIHQRFGNSVPDGNVGTGTLLLRNSNSDAAVNFPIGFSVAGNMRSVNFAVSNILLPRSIVKIISEIIGRHSVPMANIVMRGTRTNERERDHLVHMQMMRSSIFSSVKSRIALPIAGSFHNFLRDRKRHWFRSRTLANNDAPLGSDSPIIADAVDSFKSGYCSPLFVRDADHESSTYCLTVETNHTFCVGESQCIVVSNCDDPHNVKDGESDAVRKSTLQYFNEVLPTRVTDPISSAMVVIMQRVHEEDVSGNIISRDLGYTHLMLPMEFEPDRKCYTFLPKSPDTIFFEDPRTEPGELLFPARMPDWVVERDKKAIGPYACTPAESPILMSDLTMKPISEIIPGDEVVGFTTDTNDAKSRRALTRSTVKMVFRYRAPVVKVTLDSGKVIRCTPDHKWYVGKAGGNRGWKADGTQDIRPLYRPAEIGRKLMRICDDHVPEFSDNLLRDAGWLAGFFDGEGSVSNCKKSGGHRPSCAINFYQTCERNLPICDKLEDVLERLQFSYSIDERKIPEKWQRSRAYRLTGNNLPLYQKFLHAVQPVKWRDRIENAAYKANFIIGQEKVVAIQNDGVEDVFALETTTGNYVVWGLASSNSAGQFQQSPIPRGGGIIKREYWKLWPEEGEEDLGIANPKLEFPAMDFIIASVDTAYSAKTEADYNALAILGVWRKVNVPKIMLMHCWKKRLDFRGETLPKLLGETDAEYRSRRKKAWGMLEWTSYECQRFGVDTLLIEAKATGKTLAQEIRKVYSNSKWGVQEINPRGDKVARVYAVQHIFAEGMVYAPERQWAEDAITEMQHFPKGAHDDLTDAITQGISWLRSSGWALRREEVKAEDSARGKYRSKPPALYDV